MVTYCYVSMDMKSNSRFLDTDTCRLLLCGMSPQCVGRDYWRLFNRPTCFATSVCKQPLPRFSLIWYTKTTEILSALVRAGFWYTRDLSSADSSRAVRDVLNNSCHDRWRGKGGHSISFPWSPDLNPLDCYLWEHLKATACGVPVDNEEALHHRIVDACQTVRNSPGIFERMRRSMVRRVEVCTDLQEMLIIYYYKCDLSAITHKLNVSWHTMIRIVFSCCGAWNSCP
jgi:hypothetical protein